MEDSYIVINGVRYNPIEKIEHTCEGCCFDLDGDGCFHTCDIFEMIFNKSIIMKKDGE